MSSPNPSGSVASELTGVAAFSGSDVWAVGDYFNTATGTRQTLIEHYDGTSWSIVQSHNPPESYNSELTGVAAISGNDVWAVGWYSSLGIVRAPLIETWNGASWNIVDSGCRVCLNTFESELTGVAAASPTDVWAVGSYVYYYYPYPPYYGSPEYRLEPLVEHSDGTYWSDVTGPYVAGDWGPPLDGEVTGVAAVSTADIWAVGDYVPIINGSVIPPIKGAERTLVEHWDGTSWSAPDNPILGDEQNKLTGVAAISANDVWAVGWFKCSFSYRCGSTTDRTVVEHWDGTNFRTGPGPNQGVLDNELTGVAAISASDVWAVGWYSQYLGYNQPLVMNYDGTDWSIVQSPTLGSGLHELFGVAAVSARDVWAVGSSTNTATGASQTLVMNYA